MYGTSILDVYSLTTIKALYMVDTSSVYAMCKCIYAYAVNNIMQVLLSSS